MKKVPKISTPLRQLDGREQVLKVLKGFCGFNPYDRYSSHEPWLGHHETSGKRTLVRMR